MREFPSIAGAHPHLPALSQQGRLSEEGMLVSTSKENSAGVANFEETKAGQSEKAGIPTRGAEGPVPTNDLGHSDGMEAVESACLRPL